MIITIVCDVLGEENNGTTIAAMNLIRSLKNKGHVVRILCADQDKKGQENTFVVPNYNFGKIINNYVEKVGVTLAKPNKDIIEQALNNCDHVHIMVPLPLGIASLKVAKEKNISTTAGFHMQAENLTSHLKLTKIKVVNHAVYKFIYNRFYRYIDGIHYPTEFIKNTFEQDINKKTNGYIISNGVNTYVKKRLVEKPHDFKNKIIILSIGRYAREKCQDILIKAIKYCKHSDQIQLILGGKGAKESAYKKLAKKLRLKNFPIFKFFGREEIIDVLNYCDLYVHPAEIELEGIACLEAITCGKLTIVSDSKLSATNEFAVDKKCIFKNRNPKDLANIIDYWIDNIKDKTTYEQKYLNNSIIYNQDDCMQRMEKMIIEIANQKRINS